MPKPVITLLTDFGLTDHYVASMKGVMLGICPDASLIDVSHLIPPFDILQAAYTLSQAWNCFPAGTVHLAVVDPGVGSDRRPIIVETGGHVFVAPDNGVLGLVVRPDLPAKIFEITAERYFRQPVSRTFQGRDLFAPVAAWLASGVPASDMGQPIPALIQLAAFSGPVASGPTSWKGSVLAIDRFGNIVTNFKADDFPELNRRSFQLCVGSCKTRDYRHYYGQSGTDQPFVVTGSGGNLEVSLNQSTAAVYCGVKARDAVEFIWL